KHVLMQHQRTHTRLCNKTFIGKRRLVTNNEEKTHQCSLCNKTFNLSSNLNRHMRSHIGRKQYQTRQNYDTIKEKPNLVKNKIAYSGESPYYCRQCDNTFSSKSNLEKHMIIHTVGETYQCNKCE
ncbi:unnamed protein product, partial [Meganyctiphanes norvegica]